MYKILEAVGQLVRSLVALAVLIGLGFGGWIVYRDYYLPGQSLALALQEKQDRIDELTTHLEQANTELDRLDTAMRLLKTDHRVAQMAVLKQWRRAEDNAVMTDIGFAEVDDHGNFLDGYRSFTIEGDVVYIDAWVAKFLDEHVENGVPLRSTSICLFRRLFGEHQRPSEGFELDAVGTRPLAYGSGRESSPLEQEIWDRFWELANDPQSAQAIGLRALQGEAPSIRVLPDRIYWITLRASDGLTIRATNRQVEPIATTPAATGIQHASHATSSRPAAAATPPKLPALFAPSNTRGARRLTVSE